MPGAHKHPYISNIFYVRIIRITILRLSLLNIDVNIFLLAIWFSYGAGLVFTKSRFCKDKIRKLVMENTIFFHYDKRA